MPFPLDAGESPGIGYLLSRYPAVSHTFLLKEVLGLRRRGIMIEVASINGSDRPYAALPGVEQQEARTTFYVKPGSKIGKLVSLARIVLTHPIVTLRGLRTALSLGDWDLRERAFALLYLVEALLLGDWMRSRSLTHLHVHFGGPVASVGYLVSAAWKVPWSLTLHGPDEFFEEERFFLRTKFESARFLFCISDYGRSQVLRVAPGLDPSRVEVMRLGVDCAALQPGPHPHFNAEAAAPVGPVRIVCTGRLVAAKGHRILVEALARLACDGVALNTTLIGDGPERRALEDQCRLAGLDGRIQFTGALNHAETLAHVADADIFVLASFAEGLPVALMEAMALGVVCVSTCINGIPELIFNGENGLLVPAGNTADLCAAIARLVRDPALREAMGLAARRTVESDYNLPTNHDLLAAALRRRLGEVQPS
jgi:colanic acid/amylovoran biosynthesis glycosyltransferase